MTKRILILNTGGTIGMRRSAEGYVPDDSLREQLAAVLGPHAYADLPDYTLLALDRLLDSANATPADWYATAAALMPHYDDFDGFIVLHGTDTMSYTAAALSFALRGIRKPVIVTGSQIPLLEMRNDARNNLLTALILAAHHPLPEVCLYFNGRLLRGNRATKVQADGFDAFDSPNYPWLGRIGINIEIKHEAVRAADAPEQFQLPVWIEGQAAVLKLFPGITPAILQNILAPPLRGLIMESYGVGNAPAQQAGFVETLREATDRGVVIANVTQCLYGRVALDKYAAGSALLKAGVISAQDMTTEAAYSKLCHLLGLGLSPADIAQQMQTDLCGECSPA